VGVSAWFKTAEAAGQVNGSPYKFNRISITARKSCWRVVTVLDGPTMPIIGEGKEEEPNDTYLNS
jgi:hypothetical protein